MVYLILEIRRDEWRVCAELGRTYRAEIQRNGLTMMVLAMINRPHLVVLDTSHLTGLVTDWVSANGDRRRAAETFVPHLVERGWLPLLCWHQLEELLQHKDDQLVDTRLRYLRSWPLMAWIRPSDLRAGPGSVLDVLKAEVVAAYEHPDADVLRVRELARDGLFSFGPGVEAIPDEFLDWRVLRAALDESQENSRRTAAISRWRAADIDHMRIADWLDKPLRAGGKAVQVLGHLRDKLAVEIQTRGDKRIVDPGGLAEAFFSKIVHDGNAVASGTDDLSPAIQFLVNAGLELDDINPSATFGETMDLLIFQKRLRIICEANGLPWPKLKTTVTQGRLPAIVIQEGMRIHAHDQPERKGSDLNDISLLCLAPYADSTYVDKRTLESVRRARGKIGVFNRLIGHVGKARNHGEIFAALTTL
jgi:hypothetical protein